jgi:lipopolysaccharide assembly protein A
VPTAEKTDGHRAAKRPGMTVSPKLITAAVIVVAAVWFILVNKERVDIYLWVPKVTAPMWLVLLLTFVAGLVTGLLLRRRRRDHTKQH